MPIMSCKRNKKPGYKFGKSGYCYTYTRGNKASKNRAKQRALKQGRAIKVNQ